MGLGKVEGGEGEEHGLFLGLLPLFLDHRQAHGGRPVGRAVDDAVAIYIALGLQRLVDIRQHRAGDGHEQGANDHTAVSTVLRCMVSPYGSVTRWKAFGIEHGANAVVHLSILAPQTFVFDRIARNTGAEGRDDFEALRSAVFINPDVLVTGYAVAHVEVEVFAAYILAEQVGDDVAVAVIAIIVITNSPATPVLDILVRQLMAKVAEHAVEGGLQHWEWSWG